MCTQSRVWCAKRGANSPQKRRCLSASLLKSSLQEMSMARTVGRPPTAPGLLGTVTVRTPCSSEDLTASMSASSGSRKRRRNLPRRRSMRCHVSVPCSSSLLLSPLISSMFPSSTWTFTSSLLTPAGNGGVRHQKTVAF